MKAVIGLLGLTSLANAQTLTNAEIATILDGHNQLRAATAAGQTVCKSSSGSAVYCPSGTIPALQWDKGLERLAQDFSDTCRTFSQGHESNADRKARFIRLGGSDQFSGTNPGENLAWGGNSINTAAKRWGADEAKDYVYNTQFQYAAGHFTQMVWENTQYVGCGWKQCSGSGTYGGILTCNYYPPGNYGNYPYTRGSATGTAAQATTDAPTASPTPSPVSTSSNDGSSGGLGCAQTTGFQYPSYFTGSWSNCGGTVSRPIYCKSSPAGQLTLSYIPGRSGWGIGKASGGGQYYWCPNSNYISECVAGRWKYWGGDDNAASAQALYGCPMEVEELVEGEEEGLDEPQAVSVANDGWMTVLVVVIVGLLLIGAGNALWCLYMKRAMAPKHSNLNRMEKTNGYDMNKLNAEEEIEIEMETS